MKVKCSEKYSIVRDGSRGGGGKRYIVVCTCLSVRLEMWVQIAYDVLSPEIIRKIREKRKNNSIMIMSKRKSENQNEM